MCLLVSMVYTNNYYKNIKNTYIQNILKVVFYWYISGSKKTKQIKNIYKKNRIDNFSYPIFLNRWNIIHEKNPIGEKCW